MTTIHNTIVHQLVKYSDVTWASWRRKSLATSPKSPKLCVIDLCEGTTGPVDSPHKGTITRKAFPCYDVFWFSLPGSTVAVRGSCTANTSPFSPVYASHESFCEPIRSPVRFKRTSLSSDELTSSLLSALLRQTILGGGSPVAVHVIVLSTKYTGTRGYIANSRSEIRLL